jgi:hypothetical protein
MNEKEMLEKIKENVYLTLTAKELNIKETDNIIKLTKHFMDLCDMIRT